MADQIPQRAELTALHKATCRCPNCKTTFPLEEALLSEIEQEVTGRYAQAHSEQLAKARLEAEERARTAATQRFALDLANAREDSSEQRAQNKQLRENLIELTRQVRELNTERESERLNHETALRHAVDEMRQQERERTTHDNERRDEEHRLKQLELEKMLTDARQDASRLRQRLEQGSQQTQGEVLELDLEAQLKELFPGDDIVAVRTGARGVDIRQLVRTPLGSPCGTILYDTKNTQAWQPSWEAKMKEDMHHAGADHGVLVSMHTPQSIGSMGNLGGRMWAARPRAAGTLAAVLRQTLLHTHALSSLRADKGERIEALYRYITSPDFRHRIEGIQDFFAQLQEEDEKEKEWMVRKWARREKRIRIVIDTVVGLVGDFEGLNQEELFPALPPSTDAAAPED
jgi:hypothetical protein